MLKDSFIKVEMTLLSDFYYCFITVCFQQIMAPHWTKYIILHPQRKTFASFCSRLKERSALKAADFCGLTAFLCGFVPAVLQCCSPSTHMDALSSCVSPTASSYAHCSYFQVRGWEPGTFSASGTVRLAS